MAQIMPQQTVISPDTEYYRSVIKCRYPSKHPQYSRTGI